MKEMGCHSALYVVAHVEKNKEPDPLKHDTEKYPCTFTTSGWESPLNVLIEKVRMRDQMHDVWPIQVWLTKADLIDLYNQSDPEDKEELQYNLSDSIATLAESG